MKTKKKTDPRKALMKALKKAPLKETSPSYTKKRGRENMAI
jgi:hypothetical protein